MLTWATGDGWCHGTVNPKHQSVTVHYILTCTKGFAFHFHFPLSKDAHVWHASCVLSLLDFRLELESPYIHAILGQHSASNSTTSMWSSAHTRILSMVAGHLSTLFGSDRKNSSQAQSKTLMVSHGCFLCIPGSTNNAATKHFPISVIPLTAMGSWLGASENLEKPKLLKHTTHASSV